MYDLDEPSRKSRIIALVLCFFLGIFGVHRFYLGRLISGVLMLFTLGGFGIIWLIDFIRLAFGGLPDSEGFKLRGGLLSSLSCVAALVLFIYVSNYFSPKLELDLSTGFPSFASKKEGKKIGNFNFQGIALPKFSGRSLERSATPEAITVVSKPSSIVRYKDRKGNLHYVDSVEKVPEEFRDSVDSSHKLPAINKVSYASYDGKKAKTFTRENARDGVEIYVTTWCPHCKRLEDYLQKKNVSYQRYDIEQDASSEQRYRRLGGKGVPLIKVGSEILRGFNSRELDRALEDLA